MCIPPSGSARRDCVYAYVHLAVDDSEYVAPRCGCAHTRWSPAASPARLRWCVLIGRKCGFFASAHATMSSLPSAVLFACIAFLATAVHGGVSFPPLYSAYVSIVNGNSTSLGTVYVDVQNERIRLAQAYGPTEEYDTVIHTKPQTT